MDIFDIWTAKITLAVICIFVITLGKKIALWYVEEDERLPKTVARVKRNLAEAKRGYDILQKRARERKRKRTDAQKNKTQNGQS